MNIPNNVGKQGSQGSQNGIDYYKELKDIVKELDKVYKKLSKDETLADMINNIKNEFINKNIAHIEKNLSKPNYKEFNTKIIKILDIIIKLLRNYTSYNKEDDARLKECIDSLKPALDKTQDDIDKTIRANFSADEDALAKLIDDAKENASDLLEIKKLICAFEYYKYVFESPNTAVAQKIKELNTDIDNLKKKSKDRTADENVIYENITKELNDFLENDKQKYKQLFNYIPIVSYNIFDFVDKRFAKEANASPDAADKKAKSKGDDQLIDAFKKDIYFIVIGINNTQSADIDSQISENNDEAIDLKARNEVLKQQKDLLDKQLKSLSNVIQFLIDGGKQEYSTEITDIRKIFKDYKNEKEYKDSISSLVVNEEGEVANMIAKNELLGKSLKERQKQQTALLEKENNANRGRGNNGKYGSDGGGGKAAKAAWAMKAKAKQMRGGEKKSNKYYEDKYQKLKELKGSIIKLIDKIRITEGKEDSGDPFEKKNGAFGDPSDGFKSIYNTIWNDYVKETKKVKAKGITIDSLKQDNRLYERFRMSDLDPQEVLKITFQDKVIFICIILIIRTFAMVLIEFLIEYNIVSTLSRGIFVYSIIYILLVVCSVILINYDSYKLRIIVNYLNLHINSSNIFFHILLFILFIGLILIIINDNDNNLKNIDNLLNYTYIYKYIYEAAEKSNETSSLLLSQKEKLKLQYRMDIITMIIFIFSSLLILIM
uniref:Uncharacterized protein n=1 Tax=viral metagenome TaxID=1070528 RepID=A0A6C0K9D3_9ZZZZ